MTIYGILVTEEPGTENMYDYYSSFYVSRDNAIRMARALAKEELKRIEKPIKDLKESYNNFGTFKITITASDGKRTWRTVYNVDKVDAIE